MTEVEKAWKPKTMFLLCFPLDFPEPISQTELISQKQDSFPKLLGVPHLTDWAIFSRQPKRWLRRKGTRA